MWVSESNICGLKTQLCQLLREQLWKGHEAPLACFLKHQTGVTKELKLLKELSA